MSLQIIKIQRDKKQYIDLLLLADEQESMIDRYLERGDLFALEDRGVKAVCVVTDEGKGVCELKNIAVAPEFQRQGYAKRLISYLLDHYSDRYTQMIVGTGEVPGMMKFYNNCGFEYSHLLANFFTDNYNHPIIEQGVLLKDMVYLKQSIKKAMNIQEKAAQMVATAQVITVASVDENGYPRPVAMVKLKDENGAIYVSTGTNSAKTAHFKANPKAGVSIVRGSDSIVYIGVMEIVTDQAVKRSLWSDWMLSHFPGGVEDPTYCVLKFTPQSATYWIDNVFVKDGKQLNSYCQSCGMPMQTADQLGTNADGSLNQDYCCYCYKGGAFVQDCTMEGMIEHCIQYLDEFNGACNTQLSKEEAAAEMRKHFPKLKRWAK